MGNTQLQSVIGKNVVELDFVRRHPKMGWSDIRGMFGTTNPALLNSDFGFQVIHFKPPNGMGMGYDYKRYNLCVIFDMFRQEYRVFGAEQVNVHKIWPLSNEEEIESFKNYFYEYIINMSESDRMKFIGYTGVSAQRLQQAPVQQQSNKIVSAITKIWQGLKDRGNKFFGR